MGLVIAVIVLLAGLVLRGKDAVAREIVETPAGGVPADAVEIPRCMAPDRARRLRRRN